MAAREAIPVRGATTLRTAHRLWMAVGIAVLAVLLITTGNATAQKAGKAKPNTDEVSIVSLASNTVTVTELGYDKEVPLLLDGKPTYTFTQRAGEAVIVSAVADMQPIGDTNFCQVDVRVIDATEGHPGDLGLYMTAHTNKGDPGESGDSTVLVAPASNRTRTVRAFSYLPDYENGCDMEMEGEDDPPYDDAWSVSVRVSVITLRS
jgi:hypothetical protein